MDKSPSEPVAFPRGGQNALFEARSHPVRTLCYFSACFTFCLSPVRTACCPVQTPSPILLVCHLSPVLVVSRFSALVSVGLGFWSCYFVFSK